MRQIGYVRYAFFVTGLALVVAIFGCGGSTTNREVTIEELIAQSQSYLNQYEDTDDIMKTGLAEGAARRALEADSTTPALTQMARVSVTQHRFGEAVALLDGALRLSRDHTEAWGLMGDALLALGHYVSVDSCYHKMYELDDGFESLRRIAVLKDRFGDFEEALSMMDRAIDLASDWATDRDVAALYAELATIFYSHGFVDEALKNVDRSLSIVPGAVERLALRADMLRVMGDTGESDQIFKDLVNLSPNPRYKVLAARVYRRLGEKERAQSLISEALDEYDRLSVNYANLIARPYVELLLDFDIDPEKALKIAFAQSRERRDMYSYELLAWAYYKNGQYDRAWSSIGLALRREATDSRVVYRASVIAKASGLDDKYGIFTERWKAMNPLADRIYGPE